MIQHSQDHDDKNYYSLASSNLGVVFKLFIPFICVFSFNFLKSHNLPEIWGFIGIMFITTLFGIYSVSKIKESYVQKIKFEFVSKILKERGKHNFKLWSLFCFIDLSEMFVLNSVLFFMYFETASNLSFVQTASSVVSIFILTFLMGKQRGSKRLLFSGLGYVLIYLLNAYVPLSNMALTLLVVSTVFMAIIRPIYGNSVVVLGYDVTKGHNNEIAWNRMVVRDWFTNLGRFIICALFFVLSLFLDNKHLIISGYLLIALVTFTNTLLMYKFYKSHHR